ncbi:MAG: hypothetical protein EOO47_13130 [Flavobacterium sp.]|nr:MAG: hypothetical protein EOO47_13130 [Flavobacterium sp.]
MNENIEDNDWKKDAPSLAAMGKKNPFTVPDHYFEGVTESVRRAVFVDGLRRRTAENAFEVPQNYFANLQNRIAAKIEAEQPQKVAKIVPLWRRDIVKYASAACFVIIASFGAYFYQNSTSIPVAQTQPAELANEQMLYDIDESTIIEHLEAQNISTSKTTSASDTEMENYILSNYSPSDLTHELNN